MTPKLGGNSNLKNRLPSSKIVLWNRQNWEHRLVNFRVRLLDAADQEVWGQDYLTEPDAYAPNPKLGITLATEPVAAKVRIEKIGPTAQGEYTLSLAEVEVFAATGFGRGEHTFAALQQFSQVAASSEISDEGSLEELSRDNLQTAWESIQSTSLVQPSGGDDAALASSAGQAAARGQTLERVLFPSRPNGGKRPANSSTLLRWKPAPMRNLAIGTRRSTSISRRRK